MKDVVYIGPYYQTDEWGATSKACVQLLKAQSNINLILRPVWFAEYAVSPDDMKLWEQYELNKVNTFDILIQHGLPSHLNYNGSFKKNIAITSLDCRIDNSDWVTHLNLFDLIIVFSDYERELLQLSGVKTELASFQFPPLFLHPHKENLNLNFSGLKFYTIGSLDLKTGLRETISAYLSGFTILDNVNLIVATDHAQELEQEINSIKKALGIFYTEKHYPNIAIINSSHPSVVNYLHAYGDFFIDVSYNMRVSQNLLTSIVNNSMPIILNTASELIKPYPFFVEAQNEATLYQQRPLPSLYSGQHTWKVPLINSLRSKMILAYIKHKKHKLEAEQAVLASIKTKLLPQPNQWIQECLQ